MLIDSVNMAGLYRSRKSQVGDTVTWIVATIIIILILGVFMFISSLIVKANDVSKGVASLFSANKDSFSSDWISYKNELAFNINRNNKEKIEVWINEEKS